MPDCGLNPGTHHIKIDGHERFAKFERTVSLAAGQLLTLSPKLRVLSRQIELVPGDYADRAEIALVGDGARRSLDKALPLRLEIGPDRSYRVVATRTGFEPFEQELRFEDNEVEITVLIALKPKQR